MSDNEFPIKFTGDASDLQDAADTAKEQIEKAGASVQILQDLLGVKVPEAVKKMLASSELIGPALDAAFAPLAVISLGLAIADITDKASKFAGELIYDTGSLQKFDNQIKAENKTLEEYARKTKEATRALELLNAPDQKTRNTLKLKFQIEDQGGSAAELEEKVKAKTQELQRLINEHVTQAVGDAGTGMQTEVDTLLSTTKEGEERIKQLEGEILILSGRQKEAAAEEALTNKQNQNDLNRESAQRAALAAQQATAAAQQSARRAAAAAEKQKLSDTALQSHSKILTAKQLEENATKGQVTLEQALALTNITNAKAAQQQAELAQKSAENTAKIAQLERDIKGQAGRAQCGAANCTRLYHAGKGRYPGAGYPGKR